MISPSWLKLFNIQEVNQLVGGGESGVLDVTDMAAHAQYSGGYSKDHATIRLFWKVDSKTATHRKPPRLAAVLCCAMLDRDVLWCTALWGCTLQSYKLAPPIKQPLQVEVYSEIVM